MRATQAKAASIVLALGAWLWGCGERAGPLEAPAEGPAFVRAPGGVLVVLRWAVPLAHGVTETAQIGARGGRIELEEAGIVLEVPAGALGGRRADRDVEITVSAPAGRWVVVEFEPHGLLFSKAVRLEIDLRGTEAAGNASVLERLVAVYYEEVGGEVVAVETLPVEVNGDRLTVYLTHFSGYLIAMG